MSARMETEPVSWESAEGTRGEAKALGEIAVELDRAVRTAQKNDLAHPLGPQQPGDTSDQKHRAVAARDEQYSSWSAQRDQMRTEIKRGRELLEQVQRELALLRARLDDWARYEVVCGKNPLSEYMQAIAAKERIEQYLPVWLKRREEQLHALDRQMQHNAVRASVERLS
jgi:hypothetical protein